MSPKFFTLSRLLQVCAWAALILVPAISVLHVIYFGPEVLLSPLAVYSNANVVTDVQAWGVFFVRALPGLAVLYSVWKMAGLFGLFRNGEVISERAALFVRRIGQGMVAIAILTFFATPLQSVLATINNPAQSRSVVVGFSGLEIWFLIAGGLLVLIGYALHEAVRLETENRGFI